MDEPNVPQSTSKFTAPTSHQHLNPGTGYAQNINTINPTYQNMPGPSSQGQIMNVPNNNFPHVPPVVPNQNQIIDTSYSVLNNYKVEKKIGKGQFSEVIKATFLPKNQSVALKLRLF